MHAKCTQNHDERPYGLERFAIWVRDRITHRTVVDPSRDILLGILYSHYSSVRGERTRSKKQFCVNNLLGVSREVEYRSPNIGPDSEPLVTHRSSLGSQEVCGRRRQTDGWTETNTYLIIALSMSPPGNDAFLLPFLSRSTRTSRMASTLARQADGVKRSLMENRPC